MSLNSTPILLSFLPKSPSHKKQLIRSMTRDQLQEIMDFLKQEQVPYRIAQTEKTFCPKPTNTVDEISAHTGINRSTLYKYIDKLIVNPFFNPYDNFMKVNRAMSERLEEKLVSVIEEEYLIPGYYFNNKVLKALALSIWASADPSDKLKDSFSASDGWCRNFRKRHGYVWRRAKATRRPSHTQKTEQIKEQFQQTIIELHSLLKQQNKLHLLLNMDETSWRLAYMGDLTWAKKGAQSVKVRVNHNTKETVTVLATVTAEEEKEANKKLPLYILAKGATERCENKFRNIGDFIYKTDHSVNGWTTVKVMENYLQWIRSTIDLLHPETANETIHLIIDVYKTHKHEKIRQLAQQLNIQLYYIPAGYTDEYQPLDIRVFGALKGMARGIWYSTYALKPGMEITKRKAIKTLLNCWNQLSDDIIDSAWERYAELCTTEEQEDSVVQILDSNSIDENMQELHEACENFRMKNIEICEELLGENEVVAFASNLLPITERDLDDDPCIQEEEDTDYQYEEEEDVSYVIDHDPMSFDQCEEEEDVSYVIDHDPMSFDQCEEEEDVNIILPATISNLPQIEIYLQHESMNAQNRSDHAQLSRKADPHALTVGIINHNSSCCFNSFLQLLALIPESSTFINSMETNALEISVRNGVKICYQAFIDAFRTFDPLYAFSKHGYSHGIAKKDVKRFSYHMYSIINNMDFSILNYIIDIIPPDLYRFMIHRGGRDQLLSYFPVEDDLFPAGLKDIDMSTVKNYIFMGRGNELILPPFQYPPQICISTNGGSVTLVLKAVVVNIPKTHFYIFIRMGFSDDWLCCNDSCVEMRNMNEFETTLPSVALYYVMN